MNKSAEITTITPGNAIAVIEEKKKQVAQMVAVTTRSKDQLALIQGAGNSMIESGELDLDLMSAICNAAGELKDVFAEIQLNAAMD